MFELNDKRPEVSVLESEFVRLLGYPRNHILDGRPRELAQWARNWYQENGKPWVYARHVGDVRFHGDRVTVEGTAFSSKKLYDQFADARADRAFVVAVSAGKECEEMARQLWLEERPDEYFFLEMFGSAVVEHLIVTAGFRLCEWADHHSVAILPHYSPGYPGWDISDQQNLMNVILRDRRNGLPGTLQVLETGMLNPKKALLAIFGATSHVDRVQYLPNLIPCENCSLASCQYRRAPYRLAPPRIESLPMVQHNDGTAQAEVDDAQQPFAQDAKYTVSLQALRKWSQERLRLNRLQDGSFEAEFRYEGTTCSNLGRPLEFLYRVKLGPPETAYEVIFAQCIPSPADEGHKFMCEYIEEGESFIKSIAAERPLVGKPLNDVLSWERQLSPTGCFCDSSGRQHKWGLVFEVLHYALAHNHSGSAVDLKQAKIT